MRVKRDRSQEYYQLQFQIRVVVVCRRKEQIAMLCGQSWNGKLLGNRATDETWCVRVLCVLCVCA